MKYTLALLVALVCVGFTQGEWPLNKTVTGSIGWGDSILYATSRVEKVGDKFVYTYRLKNTFRRKFLVNWTIVGMATGFGEDSCLLELKPGQSIKFKLTHDEPPAELGGILRVWEVRKAKQKSVFNELLAENGFNMPNVPGWQHLMSASQPGPLPKSYVERYKAKP
jgi:hypothetical protein